MRRCERNFLQDSDEFQKENCPEQSESFCSEAVIESDDRAKNSGSSNNGVSSTSSASEINVEVCATVYYLVYLIKKILEKFECIRWRENFVTDNNELNEKQQLYLLHQNYNTP